MVGMLPPQFAERTAQRAAKRPPRRTAAPAALPAPAPLAADRIETAAQFDAMSTPAGDLISNGRLTKFLIDRRDPTQPVVHFVNSNFTVGGRVPDSARYHYSFAQAVLNIPESLEEFNAVTYFTEDKRYIAGVLHTYAVPTPSTAANEATEEVEVPDFVPAPPPGPDLCEDPEPTPDPIPAEPVSELVYGIQFYPQDVIREAIAAEAVLTAKAGIAIEGARFAFVPTGSQQTTTTVTQTLADAGVSVLPLDRILGGLTYLPLNVGEAWGYLRIFPDDLDDLRPTDIVVFDELPLDLSVVAGVFTRAVQDTNSHVNLKSKERNTPNAVLRDASPTNPRLQPFADQPVHLVIARDGFTLTPTTPEVVAEKLAERLDRPPVRLEWEPETRVLTYAEIAAGSAADALAFARRVGSKAANLSFLTHRDVLGRVGDAGSPSAAAGYDLVPAGLAVPFQTYRDFVDHPPNTELRRLLQALIDAETAGELSPKQRAERVAEVQDAFMNATFPPEPWQRLRAAVDAALPGVEKVKVRSSANAEDVPNFDGAGLHDSFAAELDKPDRLDRPCQVLAEDEGGEVKRKVKPKSLLCAVKGVYASLWNKRAIEERSFARIDQSSVAMGLAIVPAYDSESEVAANAVIVTRVLNTTDVYGYSLSIQAGNNLVTNPDPGTHSETSVAAFISDDEPISFTFTRFAQPTAEGPERTEPVLPTDTMLELVDIAKRVERAYCSAKPSYYPGSCQWVTVDNEKPTSLDLELKVLEDGRQVWKQVREFGGS